MTATQASPKPSRYRDSKSVTTAKRVIQGEHIEFEAARELVKALKDERAFSFARRVLARVRLADPPPESDLRLWFTQQHALCTYKDSDLPARTGLDDALRILARDAALELSQDPETLGLAGAICKRQWELEGQRTHLERALIYYLRGYAQGSLKDQGYTGINAAFVLDLLARLEARSASELAAPEPACASARRVQARRIREKLVNVLPPLIDAAEAERREARWWFPATVAEAYFGLGDFEAAAAWLKRRPDDLPGWQLESTAHRLAALARLKSEDGSIDEGSPEWQVLQQLLGDKAEAVRAALSGRVGLALSGGGFRASLFHIGVLARLAEIDLLRQVEVLSCVSGGSIIGAHYYLEVRNLLQQKQDSSITSQDYIDIVSRIEEDFLTGVQRNIRTRIAAEPLTNLRMLFSRYSRTQRLGELYESELYSRVKDGHGSGPRYIRDLLITPKGEPEPFQPKDQNWRRRSKVPTLILNATSLNTGHNWQFTASWMGEPPGGIEEAIDGNYRLRRMYYRQAPAPFDKVRLGHAVAASSCVPGLFEPLALPGLYERTVPGGKAREKIDVLLVDGGVHDNQGVAGLLEQDCRTVLVSDASGQMEAEDQPSSGLLRVPLRCNSILMDRVRTAQYRELEARRRASLLNTMAFVHLKQDLTVEPIDWVHCQDPPDPSVKAPKPRTDYGIPKEVQALLAGIRTDLDSFSEAEAYALIYSGYRMMTTELERRFPSLGPQPRYLPTWRFLKIAGVIDGEQPESVFFKRLLKTLSVSSGRLLKVWRLDPVLEMLGWTVAAGGIVALIWLYLLHRDQVIQIRVGPIAAALAFAALGAFVSPWIVRAIRYKQTLSQVLIGIGMGLLGWLLARLHLHVFDRLFLRWGQLKRFLAGLTDDLADEAASKREEAMEETRFRNGIFVCYSHADREWLHRLRTHLAPYARDEPLDLWDDTRIAAGGSWAHEIDRAIGRARVAVLLVSPDFLASEFVARFELPKILHRAGSGLAVVWIPIRASAYAATSLKDLQAAHDPSRPLAGLPDPEQDEAMVAISRQIAAAADINAVGNAFRIIDDFEPQVKAFLAGAPEPETRVDQSWRAEQVKASIRLVEPTGTRVLITAKDLEKLDPNAQKLIRAYERTMKELFERWTELKPKRVALDPEIRREARELSDDVRRQLCQELNGLLGFIESMGMSLQDHYAHVRYICMQPSI